MRFHDRVNYSCADHVATITLDRADRLNAFDEGMYSGVNDALAHFAADDDARVAVLHGAGDRAFSAGADVRKLGELAAQGITTGMGELTVDNEMVTDKPIIAAVHGHCVGEGVNLVLSCDLVFADEDARFAISEIRVGINAVDIPIKLARRMSYQQAFAFLTPGTAKDAAWCERAGLVTAVFPAGGALAGALEVARGIAAECAPLALRAQKATLWHAVNGDVAEARSLGQERKTLIRQSHDYGEGRQAFLEKRPPEFLGR